MSRELINRSRTLYLLRLAVRHPWRPVSHATMPSRRCRLFCESGPNRIKRYSTDGKFLGLVGILGKPIGKTKKMAASCSNTAVAVSADGSRVYVIDEDNDLIRVLLRQDKPEG